jgi:2-polyprenyl-3-methyl-5-hydroxy-6-metoxy-1,4-benzoquinol methylase
MKPRQAIEKRETEKDGKHFWRVILDWHRYTSEDTDDIVEKIRKGGELSSKEWRDIVKKGTDEEIMKFYADSVYYIYETLTPYLEPCKYEKDVNYGTIVNFAKRLLQKHGSINVLDFGGGVGELCLMLWKEGINVTYADIQGRISNFAIWRFKKRGANIKVIYSRINGVDLPRGEYDLIISDAVVEHLKREHLENFIRALSGGLKLQGFLYLLWDPTYTESFPMHILGIKQIDTFMQRYGLFRISDNIYVKSRALKHRIESQLFLLKHSRFFGKIAKKACRSWNFLLYTIGITP